MPDHRCLTMSSNDTDKSQAAAARETSRRRAFFSGYGVLLLPSVGTLIAFMMAPLAIMLVYSFRKFDGPVQVGPIRYVLDNYLKFFGDLFYWEVLGRTVAVSVVTATVSVLIAYPLAYTLARSKSRWKPVLIVIILLPLITNLVVRNYGWMVFLSRDGVLNAL